MERKTTRNQTQIGTAGPGSSFELPRCLSEDFAKLEAAVIGADSAARSSSGSYELVASLIGGLQHKLTALDKVDRKQITAIALGLYRLVGRSGQVGLVYNVVLLHGPVLANLFTAIADRAKEIGVDRPMHGALLALASLLASGDGTLAGPLIDTALNHYSDDDDNFDPVWLVERYLRESTACGYKHSSTIKNPYNVWKIQDLPSGKRILALTPSQQTDILMEVFNWRFVSPSLRQDQNRGDNGSRAQFCFYDRYSGLVARLLRRDLPLNESQIVELLERWQLNGVISAAEKHIEAHGLNGRVRAAFEEILPQLTFLPEHVKIRTRIERLLHDPEDKLVIKGESALKDTISEWLATREGGEKSAWAAFLGHALAAAGKSRPSAKWLSSASEHIKEIGKDRFIERLRSWAVEPGLSRTAREPAGDILKAMVWLVAERKDEGLAPFFGSLCEAAYRKVPGIGPGAVPLGNACIDALCALSSERATAELVRLKSRVKFSQGRKKLDEALGAAADRAGLSVADLEEIALPTFGLDGGGGRKIPLGDVTAEIRITGSDNVTLSWLGADGKPRKSVPASVKADHADGLKALRAEIKDIKALLAGQRWRLEKLYLAARSLPLADWRARYLEHPLMANPARRLIWTFDDVVAIPDADGLVDVEGRRVEPPADAVVSLWHPIQAPAAEIRAWRRRLAALDVVQPFKQAHRELYVLTDAERETATYSNRFAAHFLYQAQLNALLRARGWTHQAIGWDRHQQIMPRLVLPNGLGAAVFGLGRVEMGVSHSGADLYVTSQRVRFEDQSHTPIDLEDIPPLVFSEVMRDVDLFVGVSSIGNNPEWEDVPTEGQFRDYWWRYNKAELAQSAIIRRSVLEDLLPKLKIAEVCELDDRFLKVRGTKRTYKIHIGSGNILMEPNDQYLCIVADHVKSREDDLDLRLPFEGDRTLSLILSKAFLLAADDKITDRTILSQIGG